MAFNSSALILLRSEELMSIILSMFGRTPKLAKPCGFSANTLADSLAFFILAIIIPAAMPATKINIKITEIIMTKTFFFLLHFFVPSFAILCLPCKKLHTTIINISTILCQYRSTKKCAFLGANFHTFRTNVNLSTSRCKADKNQWL